jgi:hypothetical protein
MARRTRSFARLQYYQNRTPRGPATARVQATVHYFARGAGAQQREEMRGRWYGPDGTTTDEEVGRWARAGARAHRYTYQAVLSTRDGRLAAEDFCRALEAGSLAADWRLIRHTDSSHDHAHVLFFTDRRLSRRQVAAWNDSVRQEIEALVQERTLQAAQEAAREVAQEAAQEAGQNDGQEQGRQATAETEREVVHGQDAGIEL